ncbi:MAG: GNAT family N-acetyltransferase [Lachnospiraceae bacterium]|nr:GNAT family N-acetyltransferase [Lachnospiraceae bacterium]
MLEFEKYSLEKLYEIRGFLPLVTDPPASDITAGGLILWNKGTDMQFCVWNDTFVLRQNVGDQPAFTYPVGKDPDGMIDELILYVKAGNIPLRFYPVSESMFATIQKDPHFPNSMGAYDRRWSDYIYSFEEAKTFAGKKYSGQRNHINKFRKMYGEPKVRLLTNEDGSKLEAMLQQYETEHTDANHLEKLELAAAQELLNVADRFDMIVAVLEVEDAIAAFSVAEIVGNMLVIHVEKALLSYEGAYPTMYNGLVRLVDELFPGKCTTINREDDSGDSGLRTSKQQYHPISMGHKYLVHVNTPGARVSEAFPTLNAGMVVLTEIRPEDKHACYLLNTDVENNRYWGYDYREDVSLTGPVCEGLFYHSILHDNACGDSINFAIRETPDGEMIGEGILWQFTSRGDVEIGCRIRPAFHGHGYGAAAFGAMARYASQELGLSCKARCYHENLASYKMITKNGFVLSDEEEEFYWFTLNNRP